MPPTLLAYDISFPALARRTSRASSEALPCGPIQLADILPNGWRSRVQVAFQGKSLELVTLSRADLLKTKLFALCDRGTDLADCIAMMPSVTELEEAEPWVSQQDANPMWPDHVRATLEDLRRRVGHGVS